MIETLAGCFELNNIVMTKSSILKEFWYPHKMLAWQSWKVTPVEKHKPQESARRP